MNYARVYKETQIETATPLKLVVILYDIILNSLDQALAYFDTKRYDLLNKELSRAQDGIIELIVSLDFEKGGDIANNLYSIYLYCSRRLFEGNIEKDKNMIIEVKNILSKLRDAWEQISNMNQDVKRVSDTPTRTLDVRG
ncbi:MAG: flagellar export chaperone FliS [Brevinematales bacterium]|nr:flagellar export chaperone FliS [Brevinematales bacterium]